jgi:hypothetical protein
MFVPGVTMSTRRILQLAILFGAFAPGCWGSRYAILVGVSKYAAGAGRFDLDGPRYDVPALKAVLTTRYGFPAANVVELLDEKGTKANILGTLAKYVDAAKPGDQILFYFSGHGTSAFDASNQPLAAAIGPNSGALVPYDSHGSSLEALSQSLIIGRRDLRPILSHLNPKATAWVIIDACYSENTVRSIGGGWEGPARAIAVVSLVAGSSRGDAAGETGSLFVRAEDKEPYPYPNVVSFSASSRDQTARDISEQLLRSGRYQTVDGKPHGAFTNGLLAALGGSAADRDRKLTYQEVFESTRSLVEAGSNQRPQMLAPGRDVLDQPALDDSAQTTAPRLPAPPGAGSIRVALDSVDDTVRRKIATMPKVELAQDRFDLLVRQKGGRLSLYHRSLVLIRDYSLSEIEQLTGRIGAQSQVERLLAYRFDGPGFNVDIDVQPVDANGVASPDYRGEFSVGETVAVLARVGAPAYLLVLNVDTTGVITVLYPGIKDVQPVSNRAPVEIVRALIRPPTGTEFIKAFAFAQPPRGVEEFVCQPTDAGLRCPEIEPGDRRFERLLSVLQASSGIRSEMRTRLVTRN